MMRAFVFAFVLCFAVSALSLAEDENIPVSSATMGPAEEFDSKSSVKPGPTTITAKPTPAKPTTKPTPAKTTKKPTPAKTTKEPTPAKTTKEPTPAKTTKKPTPAKTTKEPTPAKTTLPPPPPPPQPTPSTNLTVGNYSLQGDKKEICLKAQMALQIRLMTPKANGTFIVQPNLTKADGGCKETTANLTLVFKEGFITFMFNKSVANNTVYVDALSFSLSYPLSKDRKLAYTASNKSMHLFTARIGHSYSCKSESLYMGDGLYLDVNQDRMQAFNISKSNDFGLPDPCAADKPDYRIAIAVGVTLLVLIVIVVVVYLLGRRRRTDGYQSL